MRRSAWERVGSLAKSAYLSRPSSSSSSPWFRESMGRCVTHTAVVQTESTELDSGRRSEGYAANVVSWSLSYRFW